ncbi:hypothetical protein L596_017361 [Steinernema carpocapsae]|uniref:Uncharacterized protein n=1 Tax=Steinernema carpocapsae TaxID=34508 RepID=A0A4U5N1T2_STECR|nr:hypothetical protein L596_017361 [Steinernema carpocapsae]
MILYTLLNLFAEYKNAFTDNFDAGQTFLKGFLISLQVMAIGYLWIKHHPRQSLKAYWKCQNSRPVAQIVPDVMEFHHQAQHQRLPVQALCRENLQEESGSARQRLP